MTPEAMAAAGRPAMPSSAALAAGARPRSAADEAVRFSVVVLLAALLLQRFGLPAGGEVPLSVVGPIGLLCGAFWLLRGALVLDRRRVAALLLDIGFLSWYLHIGGEAHSAFFAIYLWIVFGNGFRFGLVWLHASMGVALLGFLGSVTAARLVERRGTTR